MYFKIFILIAALSILIFSLLNAEASFNGSTPGCAGSGCHNFQSNDVSAVSIGNLQIEVTLSGVGSGENVGGELVGLDGTVIDFVNSTGSNPFVLTALNPGIYTVNAGYKEPSRNWDFTTVDLTVTSVGLNTTDNLVDSYHLSQNYPNPFNPNTTIEFSIPQSEFVTLTVYNLLGQEIATIVSDNLDAGDYSYSWDASSVASGVYFYNIQAGIFNQIKKMILLK